MRDPVFSNQRWRIPLFNGLYALVNKYHGRGRSRLTLILGKVILDSSYYFQVPYLTDARIWVCPLHTVGKHIIEDGFYEPHTCFLIERFVQNEFVFIDIGANIGTHTIAAARSRTGSGSQMVFAFEPSPGTYNVLLQNCRLNNIHNIDCVMAAVSDHSGEGLLIHTGRDPALDMAFMDQAATSNASGDRCKFVSLDDYFAEIPASPALVKIDVQGFEASVFQGAKNFLGAQPDGAVIFEIDLPFLTRAGSTIEKVRDSLEALKFERFFVVHESERSLQEITLSAIEENLTTISSYVNILAIKGRKAQTLIDALV